MTSFKSARFSYNDEEKVRKYIMRYNNATISWLPLIFEKLFYSICMWNMTPDETLIRMTLINKIFWLAIVFECVFIFLLKEEKAKNILVFEKVTQLDARALVAVRKRKNLAKVKPQHWHILIIWKKSNKINAVKTGVTLKVLCH